MPFLFEPGKTSFGQLTKSLNQLYKRIEQGESDALYLVYGEDEYMVRQVTKRLQTSLCPKAQEGSGFSLVVLESENATISAVLEALRTYGFGSLFGERQVVVVKDPVFLRSMVVSDEEIERAKREPLTDSGADMGGVGSAGGAGRAGGVGHAGGVGRVGGVGGVGGVINAGEAGEIGEVGEVGEEPRERTIAPARLTKDSPLIAALCEGLPEGTVAIFSVTQSLPRNHALVRVVEQHGVVIPLSHLSSRDLPEFVRLTCRRLNVGIDEAAAGELIERVGSDLRQLTQELEKLTAYVGERKHISIADVSELVVSLTGDVFKLTDAIASGNLEAALKLLQTLLQRREHPQLILHMITRHFRLMLQARCLLDAKVISSNLLQLRTDAIHSFIARRLCEEVTDQLPIDPKISLVKQSPYAIRIIVGQAMRFSVKQLAQALGCILQTDIALKSGSQDAGVVLQLLLTDLCRLAATTKSQVG